MRIGVKEPPKHLLFEGLEKSYQTSPNPRYLEDFARLGDRKLNFELFLLNIRHPKTFKETAIGWVRTTFFLVGFSACGSCEVILHFWLWFFENVTYIYNIIITIYNLYIYIYKIFTGQLFFAIIVYIQFASLPGFSHWRFGQPEKGSRFWGSLRRRLCASESFGRGTWEGFKTYRGHTWRITPVSKWLITMVIVSPLSRFIPLPNGLNGL